MTKLDDMLSKWPLRERSPLEADEAAERIVAAVQNPLNIEDVDESLLVAPLPKMSDEEQTSVPISVPASVPGRVSRVSGVGVESKMSKDRTRERTSFQELAKMATTPPPPTPSMIPTSASSSGPNSARPSSPSNSGASGVVRGEESSSSDSGIVDLKAIATADPSGEQRAQSTPLAAAGLFEDESAPAKPAMSPAVAERLSSTPPSSAAPSSSAPSSVSAAPASASAVAQTSAAAKREEKKSGGAVIFLGALVAAGAIAAGVVFYVRSQHKHDTAAATPTTTAAPVDTSKTKSTSPATTATTVAQNDTQELADLPETVQQNGKTVYRAHVKPGAGGVAPVASGGGAPDPAATGIDPKLIANVPTGAGGGGGGDLSEAMKTAAGGGSGLGNGAAATTGPANAGNVPQRPSQGQVAGAVGGVMPSAKACLGSDEPMSRANITFQSDGTVKSVSVTGFAAGKPQESCIKGALSKATVSPFAEASYSIPVIIRSN